MLYGTHMRLRMNKEVPCPAIPKALLYLHSIQGVVRIGLRLSLVRTIGNATVVGPCTILLS